MSAPKSPVLRLVLAPLLAIALVSCSALIALETPPPPPGLDLTAGGNYSTSSHYRLIGAIGESPGSNGVMHSVPSGVSSSASYTLQGGIAADTQARVP